MFYCVVHADQMDSSYLKVPKLNENRHKLNFNELGWNFVHVIHRTVCGKSLWCATCI